MVEPGADRLTLPARAGREGPVRCLFLGSVTRRKRVLELVRAFGGVAFAVLDVCGSLERERDYVARVRAAASDRVTFHGERSDAEVGGLLAEADVLVMPSSLEGWGMAATEALAAGVPVIAARSPGLSEALAGAGDGAWLVEPSELGAALRQFSGDASLRERMRRGAIGARTRAITWHDSGARFAAILSDG